MRLLKLKLLIALVVLEIQRVLMVVAVMVPVQLDAEMGVPPHVIGHVVEIVVAALENAQVVVVNTHLVAVVHVVIIVPVHAQIHVPVPAQGHVLMTVKVLVQGIVKVDALQAVLHVMAASLVTAVMVAVALGAIHHVIQVLMHNLVSP